MQEGPLWVVGINAIGDPIKGFPSKRAAELAIELRKAGEEKLGSDISAAAAKAQDANAKAKPTS
jgi:hypothetical protein